jgi:hypothetical protein
MRLLGFIFVIAVLCHLWTCTLNLTEVSSVWWRRNTIPMYIPPSAGRSSLFTEHLSSGISAEYFFGTQPICRPPKITSFYQPFSESTCLLNYIGNQANCSIYTKCLLQSTNFVSHNLCLETTFAVYTSIEALNGTSYLVRIFLDDMCTVPLPGEFNSLAVPFGCFMSGLMDQDANVCPITSERSASNSASTLESKYF